MNTEILGRYPAMGGSGGALLSAGTLHCQSIRGERTWLDFMAPVERFVYRVCGIDPAQEMDWKQFLKALLMVNLFWFFWGMLLLVFQGWLPLNPDGNPGSRPIWRSTPVSRSWSTATCNITAARRGVELFHPAVRHHALPVRHRSLRHGGHGRCHEGAGCQDHEGPSANF